MGRGARRAARRELGSAIGANRGSGDFPAHNARPIAVVVRWIPRFFVQKPDHARNA
ncbi:protein of unknown function [Burkholderia multivorans]